MASEGGGKIKNKRGPSSTKPYDRRKSLFRRITDSIKDVLRPSWLASQGDGETVEIEDSAAGTSEDAGNEEIVTISGPSSQSELRSGSVPLYSNRSSNANQNMQWQQTPKESMTSGSQGQAVGVRHPTWGNSFGMFDKSNFVQKHSEGARISDNRMDMSAVGLGGLPPPPSSSTSITAPEPSSPALAASATPTKRLRLPVPEHPLSASTSFPQQTEKSVISQDESSLLLSEDNPSKRQRLWSPEMSRKGRSFQTTPQNRPSFKISVFCASSGPNQSLHDSPFYSGKTTFGGASAYRRQSLTSSLPYSSSLPIRKSVTPKPLHNPGSVVLSSSANQILKTLERLSDAKKTDASVSETESQSLLSFTPKSYRRPSRPIQTSIPSRSVIVPSYGPPVSQMSSPTPARLQPNRQVVSIPVQGRALAASAVTRSPLAEDDEDQMMVTRVREPLASSTERVGHGSGKMKHPKSYETRKKPGRPEEEEIVEAPSLRTDFTLPMQSLATFNLNMPLASSAVSSAGNTVKGWPSTSLSAVPSSTLSSTAAQCQSKLQFTFSSPIQKTGPESSAPPASRSSPAVNFQFSSPLSVGQGESSCRQQQSGHAGAEAVVEGSSPASAFVPPAWGSTAPKPKQKLSENSFGAGFTFGNHSAVKTVNAASNGGLKPSSPLKTGSVMDILGGGSKNTDALSSSSIKPATTFKQGSVMDLLGGSTGKQSASCGVENNYLLAKFAPPVGSWECDSCMLQNKPEASRCVACESAKPGAAKSGTSVPSKVSSSAAESLLAKFAAPSGSWECDSCLLQNVPEATKCVACETLKPGAAKPAAPSADSLMAKFRKPEGSWECDVCMVQNTAAQSKCLACESPRPGAKPSGSSPPSVFSSVPTIGSIGSGGGLVLGGITSSTASPFLASASAAKDPSATGFSGFGVTAPSTASGFGTANAAAAGLTSFGAVTTASVGFVFGAPTSAAKDLNSGSQNSSNSNNSSAALGFRFGGKDASSSANSSVPGGSSFGGQDTSNSKDSSAPGGFKFGSQDTLDSKDSSASGGFKFGSQNISNLKDSSVPGGGFTFESKVTSDPNCASLPTSGMFEVKTTSSDLTSVTVSKSDSAGGFKFRDAASLSSATPSTGGFVFGQPAPSTGQTAVATAPSLAPTVATTPAFSFSSTNAEVRPVTQPSSSVAVGSTDSTFKPVFGGVKPANSLPLGAAPSLGGGGTGLTQGGFSFNPSASSGSFSLPSSSASSETSNTKGGFSFGGTDRTASGATQGSQAKPFTFDKPAVNGDVGGGPVFAFGQQATSAPAGGFPFSAAKNSFVFGADTAGKTEKHPHPDSDLGPSATKKGFGVPNPSASVNSSFKLGQTDDPSAKPSGIFGAPASSFGGSGQSSFALAGAQSNAASSSLFGAGCGSSSASQGQFAFSFGAAGQNSAAAASSFGSDSSSAQGFSFKPTKTFNFGSTTPGVFQFGNSTAETASSQPAMSTAPFMFGPGSQSADSTSSASGFSTAPAFGAAQPSFNIGAGTGDNRKIKKAVRRNVRK